MGKNDVNFRISGDSGDAQRAWLEIIGVMKQMQTELGRMGQKLETETKRTNAQMEKTVSTLERMRDGFSKFRNAIGILGSLRTAYAMLNSEMQVHKDLGATELERRLRYENALRTMANNMSAADFKAAKRQIEASAANPLDRAQVAQNVAYAISSVGLNYPVEQLVSGSLAIQERFPELSATPESSNLIAAAMLRLFQASPELRDKDDQGRAKFDKAIAYYKDAMMVSAQGRPEDFAKYTAVAASQLVSNYGYSPDQAFAILASTQQQAGDITGRMGMRSAINMSEYLQTLGLKHGFKTDNVFDVLTWMQAGKSEDARRAQAEAIGIASPHTLIKALKGLDEGQIEGGMTTAAKFSGPWREIIRGEGATATALHDALGKLSVETSLQREAERQLMKDTDPAFAMSRADFSRRQAIAERQERVSSAARYGSYIKDYETIQDTMDYGGMRRWWQNQTQWLRGEDTMQTQVEAMARGALRKIMTSAPGYSNIQSQMGIQITPEYVRAHMEDLSPERQGQAREILQILERVLSEKELKVRVVNDAPVTEAPNPAAGLE